MRDVGRARGVRGSPVQGRSDTAAYCSAAWLPAYFLLAYRRQGRTRARSVGAILLPFVLILTLAFGLFLWYDNTLGHGPDVAAFVDYARAYGAGFGSLPLDAAGAMWILLFPLALLVAAMLKQASIESNDLPPLVAAFALVWITSTYFFGRSHPNNVLNLSAISCMGVFIALRHGLQQAVFARIAIAPFLTILLLASFGGEAYPLRHLVDAPPTHISDVAAEFPRVDGSLAKLMKKADVRPGDPLVYVANRNESTAMPLWSLPKNAGRQVSENPPWIPAVPFDEIDLLPPTVRSKYFSRYIARARLSGWLVEANDTLPNDQWLREQLAGSYRVTRQYDNNSWRVTWYEYAGSSAS